MIFQDISSIAKRCPQLRRRLIFILISLIGIGLLFELLPYSSLQAQPYSLPEKVRGPTEFGKALRMEMRDFRLNLFTQDVIDDRCKRGVVCVSWWGQLEGNNFSEHSTNQWETVGDALKDMSSTDGRKRHRPQVRVVQKDAILQSSISFPFGEGAAQSGCSTAFLQQTLQAGDIIMFLPVSD